MSAPQGFPKDSPNDPAWDGDWESYADYWKQRAELAERRVAGLEAQVASLTAEASVLRGG